MIRDLESEVDAIITRAALAASLSETQREQLDRLLGLIEEQGNARGCDAVDRHHAETMRHIPTDWRAVVGLVHQHLLEQNPGDVGVCCSDGGR